MTTASKVTLARIAMVPVYMLVLYLDYAWARPVALIIFIVAGATDAVDGYIARNFNQISDFGKFIDPLADKLLVTASILVFIEAGQMPAWAVMLIITREFAVTGLRLVAVGANRVIAAGLSGKIKTVSSMVAIGVMLTPVAQISIGPVPLNDICVWVMVITTVVSGVEYFIRNIDLLNLSS